MGSLNRVYLMGNLTRDIELRQTSTGRPVADFGIAVSERYKNREGEQVESVCFADVVAWGHQAENCAQYLHKGSLALVEGKLQFDQWETDKGEKRSRLRVTASRVEFLNGAGAAPAGNGDDGCDRDGNDH